jgi:alpha-aminoadipate carrier protein LysW
MSETSTEASKTASEGRQTTTVASDTLAGGRQTTTGTGDTNTPAEVCPACGARLETASDLELGEILWCEHCGAELEVVSTDPLRIDLFEEEEK